MNRQAYEEHDRMKSGVVAALGLDQDRTYAWDHLLSKIRVLQSRASSTFRRELMEVLDAEDVGSDSLLEAARRPRSCGKATTVRYEVNE